MKVVKLDTGDDGNLIKFHRFLSFDIASETIAFYEQPRGNRGSLLNDLHPIFNSLFTSLK